MWTVRNNNQVLGFVEARLDEVKLIVNKLFNCSSVDINKDNRSILVE